MSQFTHLHLHTEYSLLDGANKIKVLAKKVKEQGMSAVAMTDHGNMFGVIDFYNTMKKEGIKPIIGMEAYIHNQKEINDKSVRQRFHICLYAKNEVGYKNLMYLTSQAYIDGFYYYPRINWELLKNNSDGLICSSACLQGEVNWHLNTSEKNLKFGAGGYKEAKKVALRYKEVFGDDFYLELMRHGIGDQFRIDKDVIRISKETKIKIVATNDTHYTEQKDADAHEAFMCIAMNKLYDDPNRLRHSVHEFYLKSPEEMALLFADIPEAIETTQEITNKCNVDIKLGNPTPPNFKFAKERAKELNITLPKNETYSLENDKVLFIEASKIGLENRLKIVPKERHQEYKERLQIEMDIINSMKFPGYMLIVWDFVNEAKKMKIPVGPGRGCLTKDALVYRFNKKLEAINIDKIQIGDRVLTHNLRVKEVEELFVYDIEEELIEISTFYGDNLNKIRLTKEHKVYIGKNEWLEAKDITKDNWLILPKVEYKAKIIKSFGDDFKIKNSFYFRKFLGKLIGDFREKKELNFSFNKNQKREIAELEGFIEENNFNYSFIKKDENIAIKIENNFLDNFLNEIFKNSIIPTFIFDLPKDEILDILDSFTLLNGSFIDGEIKLNLNSKELALSLKNLLFKISIPSSLNSDYSLTIPSNCSIYDIPKEIKGRYKIKSNYIKLKVENIKIIAKEKTKVYDFKVKDDHSYTTSNYIVHNSAAGSLVAYSLEITDIDPIPYGLLFERFLNPERVSMPDIDMDFCQARRQEILDYVVDKYGRHNVAQIITFGKLLAKGVIRDVGRVLDMPYSQADAMAKLIPDELGINLKKAFEKEPKIKALLDSNPLAKRVWDYSLALEGLNRNAGTHAAGVVISNEELWHKAPLFKPTGLDTLATQYSGKYVEDVDLIKFDFLGLKTLTVIDEALKLIQKRHNKKIDFQKENINDKKVYDYISTGNTLGLFQIESSGMQDLAKKLKPSTFEDVIAMLALYRPGPMESGMLDDFVERKHGRAKITYMFKELEPILKPTYGVIVYQEQVMQIVQTIGGFSLGGADLVRRAMGKKIKEEMDKLKDEFANGANKKGFDKEKSIELFDLIVKFAGYGFNKSHSAAYAMITFYTSFLKCYYPTEFMAAILTLEKNNTDKVVKYVDEFKKMDIDLLPPNINISGLSFEAKNIEGKESIMFGMGAIKGAGDIAIKSMLEARKEEKFKDISDFISRIDSSKVNKKVIESLIKAGAFDDFNHSRKALLSQIEDIIESAKKAGEAKKMAEGSLFGEAKEMININLELNNMQEFSSKEILEMEKETLGFYVSGHPLDEYREEIDKINYTLSSQIEELADGSEALIVGKVDNIMEKTSKKGNKFAIINVMDLHGTVEFTLFETQLKELKENYNLEVPLAFKLKITKDGDFIRFKTLSITPLNKAKNSKVKVTKEIKEEIVTNEEPVIIALNLMPDIEIIEDLLCLVEKYKGNSPLEIHIKSKKADVIIESKFYVNSKIIEEAKKIF